VDTVWYDKCGVRRIAEDVSSREPFFRFSKISTSAMSPHKVDVLPSPASLPSYGISKNGFLPAEAPLLCLPIEYYQPWEHIIEALPALIEKQLIRQCIDELPVLSTCHLHSEAEWQRAYSILALFAQGYIWTGPEPSEVSQASRSPKSAVWY
jgi:indoleamine 2,3-dioxygenase